MVRARESWHSARITRGMFTIYEQSPGGGYSIVRGTADTERKAEALVKHLRTYNTLASVAGYVWYQRSDTPAPQNLMTETINA